MSNQKMNSRAKENIKLGASTLINNAACIEMGRTRHWYSGLIAAILAVAIAIIPLMVSQFSITGGSILASPTYSIDDALIHFQEDLNEKNVSMQINAENDEMTVANWSALDLTADNSWKCSIEGTEVLEVFWTETTDELFSSFVSNISENVKHSYFIFAPKGFIFTKIAPGTTSSSSLGGQYDRISENFDLKDIARKNSRGESFLVSYDTKTNDTFDTYYSDSIAAWKLFLTDSYETYKNASAWQWSGIMFGVYALFVFFMGLMIFLMTRGKNNPFRIYTFIETQKIAWWAAFAPAVVGCILGFLISSMAMMGFIFAYGLRIMWLATKSLRPQ